MTPHPPGTPAAQPPVSPAGLAERVTAGILADLAGAGHGAVVDSPPGAGKSALVVAAAARLASGGERVMVIAQTNEQVDDLIERLANASPGLPIGRVSGREYVPSARVARYPQVMVAASAADLAVCPVVAGTAHKWATVRDSCWPWAIVDEAYQMRLDLLLRVAGRFERALFVGDPGQLDPFSTVQTERWTGLTWDPMQSAVAVLLRHNPDLPVHRLPVSWRLPEPAAAVVAEAFYPFTGFRAGTTPDQRRMAFTTASFGQNPCDEALETAAASGWALYELPARHTVRTDADAVTACATLAARLVRRGAVSYSERAGPGLQSPRAGSRWGPRTGTRPRRSARCSRRTASPGSPPTRRTACRVGSSTW